MDPCTFPSPGPLEMPAFERAKARMLHRHRYNFISARRLGSNDSNNDSSTSTVSPFTLPRLVGAGLRNSGAGRKMHESGGYGDENKQDEEAECEGRASASIELY